MTILAQQEATDLEFSRQAETLVRLGYPRLGNMDTRSFRQLVEPLRQLAREVAATAGNNADHVPFVIIIKSELVPAAAAIDLVEVRGKRGFTTEDPDHLQTFAPIDEVAVPDTQAYLLIGPDSGAATLNIRPNDALPILLDEGRSPLTLDEGLALVTHYPQILKDKNCFQMLGSRCGDKRVTGLWLSKGAPRLGWCWAGNVHTWLGAASCRSRIV